MRTGLAAAGLGLTHAACGSGAESPSQPAPPAPTPSPSPSPTAQPVVAITGASEYPSARRALREALDLVDGIDKLVREKTVTVKVNLTGWGQTLLGQPATETYVVNGSVAEALVSYLLDAGARRVRLVESVPVLDELAPFARSVGWDTDAMTRVGAVEFINTRSGGGRYVTLPVRGSRLFEAFEVHPAYAETDVFVSLAKLKNHRTSGITLAMKNLFGMPPNSRYGTDAPSEDAVGMRFLIHDRRGSTAPLFPGELRVLRDQPPEVRVPNVIADLCTARPIHLSVIEGITTVSGGEGPWHESSGELLLVRPGVIIAGRDPVATDAVATAVMGYTDPLSTSLPPFHFCENHIRFAHDAGLGMGDLSRIEVRGMTIAETCTPFAWL
jgi:uncharacterized protein (DUF362 family)